MAEMIWVETLTPHREVTGRFRCAGPEIRIGRGYANDVILDDPYIAAEHLRIWRGADGVLVAEDIGSANGLFLHKSSKREGQVRLDGDKVLRIGKTHLRIRDASFAVPRERNPETWPLWPVLAALSLLTLGLAELSTWLADVAQPTLLRYLQPIYLPTLVVLGWTALWTVLSRIFGGQSRFERHLLLALLGLLGWWLYQELARLSAFALSWRFLANFAFVAAWSILAALCFFHLRTIQPSRLVVKGAVVALLAVCAIGLQLLSVFDMRRHFGTQDYVEELFPPALRLAPPHDEAAFFADVEQLKSRLDRDRAKNPP